MWWLDAQTTPGTSCVDAFLPQADENFQHWESPQTPVAPVVLARPQTGNARRTCYISATAKIAFTVKPRKNTDQKTSDTLASSFREAIQAEHAQQLANVRQSTEAKLKKAEQRFAEDMRRLRLTIANLEDWQQKRDADLRQKLHRSQAATSQLQRVLSQRTADLSELKACLSAERRKANERETAIRELAANKAEYRALLDAQVSRAPHDQHIAEYELAVLKQQLANTQQRSQATIAAHQQQLLEQKAEFANRLEQSEDAQLETARELSFALARREEELADALAALESEQRQRGMLESQLSREQTAAEKHLFTVRLLGGADHDQHVVEFKLAFAERRFEQTARQSQAELAALNLQHTQREANLEKQLEQALAEQRSITSQLASVASQRDQDRVQHAQELAAERKQSTERDSALREMRSRIDQQQALLDKQVLHAAHEQHVVEFKLASANQQRSQDSSQLQTLIASANQRVQQLQQREAELVRQLEQAGAQERSLATQHASKLSELKAELTAERKQTAERDNQLRNLKSKIVQQQAIFDNQVLQAAHEQHVVEFRFAQANQQLIEDSTQLQTVITSGNQRVQQLQQREAELVRQLEQAGAEKRRLATQHASKLSELEAVLAAERKQAAERDNQLCEMKTRITQQQAILDSQLQHAAHEQHVVEFKFAQANQQLIEDSSQLQTVIASGNNRVQQLQQREAELVRHLEQAGAQQRSLVTQHASKLSELEAVLAAERKQAAERDDGLREMNSKIAQQQAILDSQLQQAAHEQHVIEFKLAQAKHELIQNGSQLKTAIASNDQHLQHLQLHNAELARQLEQAAATQQQSAIQLASVVAQRDEKLAQLNAALANEREQRTTCEARLRSIESKFVEQRALVTSQILRVPHDQHVVAFQLARAERQIVENNSQLQDAIASSSHQNQLLQQREVVLSRQLRQALAEQKQATLQRTLTVAQRDERLAELNAALATERKRLAECESTIRQLEIKLARRQDGSQAQAFPGPHDQHVWEFKVAKAEQHRVETLVESRKSIKLLESQIELRESEVLKRLAESWSARRRTEIELAEAVSKHDRTVAALNARLATLQRLADDRAAAISELEDKLLELKKSRVVDAQRAQSATDRTIHEPRQSAWIRELEASVKSLKRRLDESIAAETAQRDTLAQEQAARVEAETKVEECFAAMERLQRQASDLQARLQREAGGRRKAEGALRRTAEVADDNTIARLTQIQIDSEQRIERLTNELEATKHHLLGLRRQAQARLQSDKQRNQVA